MKLVGNILLDPSCCDSAATRYPILFPTKLLPVTQAGNNLSNDLDQISKKLKEDRKAQKKDECKRLELDSEIVLVRGQRTFLQVSVSGLP